MPAGGQIAEELKLRGPQALAGLKAAFSARHTGVAGQARLAHDLLLTHYLLTEEAAELSASFSEKRPPTMLASTGDGLARRRSSITCGVTSLWRIARSGLDGLGDMLRPDVEMRHGADGSVRRCLHPDAGRLQLFDEAR